MSEFCRFLTHGLSIAHYNNELAVRPCCWFKGKESFDNYKAAREKWASLTDWIPDCIVCKQQEQAGHTSFRKSSFDIVPDGMPTQSTVALDISIDMQCNAACVICGPELSSAWGQQIKKQKIININTLNGTDYLDDIVNNVDLDNVRRIKFFGGEPLLTDTHLKVLEKIPNPEHVDIWYTTNGSIIPDERVIAIWEKFKLVYFEASVDGVGDRFSYIRWPLTWDKIRKNLQTVKETAPNNLLIRINHTLNPFNVLYYDELENWVNSELSTNRLGDATEINIHPCWGTWDLAKTPEPLRQLVYKKFGDHDVCRMLAQMPSDDYESIKKFTDQWDHVRKCDWKLIFPEIVDYFP